MNEKHPSPHYPSSKQPSSKQPAAQGRSSEGAPGADHLEAAARQAAFEEPFEKLRWRLQERLPEIVLGECIGRGGMGVVFRARQRALDRPVAVKVLLSPPGDVAGWGERFQREAQALARLQHPGIVTIHDYGQSDDLAWLVMELVEGTSLRVLMEGERLSPGEALAIVPPICEALQYAHERGIVHRDVKPENVLLDTEGHVKLVDFGLAKLSAGDGGENLTRSDQAMGTPRYMAPEQLERPLEVDHRADIFSLGVVLYEMLTGHVPAGVIEPPSRKVSVNVGLDEVVLRALQREPERRYQSATDLEQGVQGAQAAAPREERAWNRGAEAAHGEARQGAAPEAGSLLASHIAVLLLGVVTFIPLAGMGLMVAEVLGSFSDMAAGQGGPEDPTYRHSITGMVGYAMLGLFVTIPLIAFYVWHALTRARFDTVLSVIWVVLLLFASVISMPIYWFANVWTPLSERARP